MPRFVNENTLHPCGNCKIAYPELTVGYFSDGWRISIMCEICGNKKVTVTPGKLNQYPAQEVLDTIEAWNVENPKEGQENESGV